MFLLIEVRNGINMLLKVGVNEEDLVMCRLNNLILFGLLLYLLDSKVYKKYSVVISAHNNKNHGY